MDIPRTKRMAIRILWAMAQDRGTYINACEHYLIGAIVHYYQVQLAKKNGLPTYVDHWMKEVKRLVENELRYQIIHKVRGFRDLRKAFDEAVSETQEGDHSFRKSAETTVKKDHNLKKLRAEIDDDDTEAFWKYVKKHADMALESKGF